MVGACLPSDETPAGETRPRETPPRDALPGDEVGGVPVLGDLSRVGEAAALVRASAVAVSAPARSPPTSCAGSAGSSSAYGVDLMLTAELADVAVPRITVVPGPGHVAAARGHAPVRGPQVLA